MGKKKKNHDSTEKQNSDNTAIQHSTPQDIIMKHDEPIAIPDEKELMKEAEKSLQNTESTESFTKQGTYTKEQDTKTEVKQSPNLLHFLQQFFSLLLSFITALFPNIADIFTWRVFRKLCSMVRIEHTVFALPFAYIGLLLANHGNIDIMALVLITITMFGIRSFAMTVNRIVDVSFDAANPRTQNRELVTGEVTLGQAKAFAFLSLCIFIASCALINTTLLMLSPIPIIFSILYSYMKRFTWYCHFLLGLILGLAPIAGQLSILGHVTGDVITLAFGIVFWVAGFDILYACQDAEFDKEHNLYSIPASFGIPTALLIARLCHINTIIFFFLFGILADLGSIWYLIWCTITALLLWEHHILSPTDLSKINHAFFTINACISIAVLIGVYFA